MFKNNSNRNDSPMCHLFIFAWFIFLFMITVGCQSNVSNNQEIVIESNCSPQCGTTIQIPPQMTKVVLAPISIEETTPSLTLAPSIEPPCVNPCLFNIELGVTNWSAIMSQLADWGEIYQPTSRGRFFVELKQESADETYELKHFFEVENDTIVSLEADVKFRDEFEPSAILQTYGAPDDVWIRTFKDEREGVLPFRIYLIYEKHAMLLLYGLNGERAGNQVNGCLAANTHNTSTIVLLLPKTNEAIDFEQLIRLRSRLNEEGKSQRLEEVSEMSLEAFHNTFSSSDNERKCIVTEAEHWSYD